MEIELLLGDGPIPSECLAQSVAELIGLRDELIAARRAGVLCERELASANAAISSLFGVEFPIAGRQWN